LVGQKDKKKRDQLRRQRERCRVSGADEVVFGESVVKGKLSAVPAAFVQGRCETVASSVPVVEPVNLGVRKSVETVPVWRRKQGGVLAPVRSRAASCVRVESSLEEAERKARETLACRRAMENRVAVRKAELLMRSLNDEKRCQDYEDLKRQRVIQWQNEALAKSQSSAKSLDPDSSVSMREFRELGKKNADLEYEKKVYMDVIRKKCGDRALLDAVNLAVPMGSETEAEMQMAAEDCAGLDDDIPWIRENRVVC